MLEGYSSALVRITMPKLENIVIRSLLSFSDRVLNDDNPLDVAPTMEHCTTWFHDFLSEHAPSLLSLTILEPILPESHPKALFPLIFSNLINLTITGGEGLGGICRAPKLKSLEVRAPLSKESHHQDMSGFATAECLELWDGAFQMLTNCTEFLALKNVDTLHLHIDPNIISGHTPWEGLVTLLLLIIPIKPPSGEQWYFPKLQSLTITLESFVESMSLKQLGRMPDDWSDDEDYDEGLSENNSDPGSSEYMSDSSQWSGSGMDEEEVVEASDEAAGETAEGSKGAAVDIENDLSLSHDEREDLEKLDALAERAAGLSLSSPHPLSASPHPPFPDGRSLGRASLLLLRIRLVIENRVVDSRTATIKHLRIREGRGVSTEAHEDLELLREYVESNSWFMENLETCSVELRETSS